VIRREGCISVIYHDDGTAETFIQWEDGIEQYGFYTADEVDVLERLSEKTVTIGG
jgi:hypothetical protein